MDCTVDLNIFLWNPQKVFFKVRDYICKRSLVLKCVVSASNEFILLSEQNSLVRVKPRMPLATVAIALRQDICQRWVSGNFP